jgi:hypothetical protein
MCSHEFEEEDIDLIIMAFRKVWGQIEALR